MPPKKPTAAEKPNARGPRFRVKLPPAYVDYVRRTKAVFWGNLSPKARINILRMRLGRSLTAVIKRDKEITRKNLRTKKNLGGLGLQLTEEETKRVVAAWAEKKSAEGVLHELSHIDADRAVISSGQRERIQHELRASIESMQKAGHKFSCHSTSPEELSFFKTTNWCPSDIALAEAHGNNFEISFLDPEGHGIHALDNRRQILKAKERAGAPDFGSFINYFLQLYEKMNVLDLNPSGVFIRGKKTRIGTDMEIYSSGNIGIFVCGTGFCFDCDKEGHDFSIKKSTMMGLPFAMQKVHTTKFTIPRSTKLVVFSDGFDIMPREKTQEIIRQNAHKTPHEIQEALFDALITYTRGGEAFTDDTSVAVYEA